MQQAQEQTKRVGTVEEYVTAMECSWAEQCRLMVDCELAGEQVFWATDMITSRFLEFAWHPNYSEDTKVNIIVAYAKTRGAINVKLSAHETKYVFSTIEVLDMLKRMLSNVKHTISAAIF